MSITRPDGTRRLPGPPRGFTLTELLVALTLSGVVLSSVIAFFVSHARTSRLGDTRIEAVQRARFANELLRREIALAGSGMPNAQPMVVYAGPDDFVFSADLASSTPGDQVAVYYVPGAPVEETEGADSGSVTLPNGAAHPGAWFGADGQGGPAETIALGFVDQGDGTYALTRTVNAEPAETLLRGLERIEGRGFFSYEALDMDGFLQDIGGGPFWHEAAIHGSAADTSASALTDSIKIVQVAFQLTVRGREGQIVRRPFTLAIGLKNAGLVRNSACGEPPVLGVTPNVTVVSVDPPAIEITWPPAVDERGGESDVIQYTLYRRALVTTIARPVVTIPPNPDVASYTYTDTDIEQDQTYVYALGTTDCTPVQSELAESGSVTVN